MSDARTVSITENQKQRFHEDGFLYLPQSIDKGWVEVLKSGLEQSMAQPGEFLWTYTDEDDGRHFHNENRRWHEIDAYCDFIFQSPVGELIGKVAGWEKACLLFDSAFYRSPGTATRTPWHQDLPYLCVDGDHVLASAWIPLYPIARESTLECVRGSHRWNKRFFRMNFDPEGERSHMQGDHEERWDRIPDIDGNRDQFEICGYAMSPGDCLILDGEVLHGSAGNLDPEQPLAVVTIRMLGDDAIYRPDKPGGVQPDLDAYAREAGLRPGDPVESALFPRVWSIR